jgi:ELWxxDGT repeat protein
VLVRDIVPGVSSSNVESLIVYKSKIIFVAQTDEGKELWQSDGTSFGTNIIRDIRIGEQSSWPQNFIIYKEWLFFSADEGIGSGREIWKSDTIAHRTYQFNDLSPGVTSSDPKDFVIFKTYLFYSAYSQSYGRELWVSDGEDPVGSNPIMAYMIYDISPGGSSSNPSGMVVFNRRIYFAADDGLHGNELWKSDGTTAGTALVIDINLGSGSSFPSSFATFGCYLYFSANVPSSGTELWRSNGYAEGTELFKDIYPHSYSSNVANMYVYNAAVFFSANDGIYGAELWISSGTGESTKLLKDINVGEESSFPMNFFSYNQRLYFVAATSTFGREIWYSDGTIQGTELLKEIFPGPEHGASSKFVATRGRMFFVGTDPLHGSELYGSQVCGPGTHGNMATSSCTECPPGLYSKNLEADRCTKWQDCLAGYAVDFTGNSINDRTCKKCKLGEYSSMQNAPRCSRWSSCGISEFQINTPSIDRDRLCQPCSSGQYTMEVNGNNCLPLFDYVCNKKSYRGNWKKKRFCHDLYNLTMVTNNNTMKTAESIPIGRSVQHADIEFVIWLSCMSISLSGCICLVLVCSYSCFSQKTRLSFPASNRIERKVEGENVQKPWVHVLNDYLSKPHKHSAGESANKHVRRNKISIVPKENDHSNNVII